MNTKKVYLYFPKSETEKPIICNLIKEYDLTINIFRGKVTPEEEGYLSLEITGEESNMQKGFDYLKNFDVEIHTGNVGVMWNGEQCTHCGNCTVHCPTKALNYVDLTTREMAFNDAKCVECLACLTHCPFGVCSSHF